MANSPRCKAAPALTARPHSLRGRRARVQRHPVRGPPRWRRQSTRPSPSQHPIQGQPVTKVLVVSGVTGTRTRFVGGRLRRRREAPDPGPRPNRPDSADAAHHTRACHPRLGAQRHLRSLAAVNRGTMETAGNNEARNHGRGPRKGGPEENLPFGCSQLVAAARPFSSGGWRSS